MARLVSTVWYQPLVHRLGATTNGTGGDRSPQLFGSMGRFLQKLNDFITSSLYKNVKMLTFTHCWFPPKKCWSPPSVRPWLRPCRLVSIRLATYAGFTLGDIVARQSRYIIAELQRDCSATAARLQRCRQATVGRQKLSRRRRREE